jgi:hypothetical protein
MRSPYSRSGAGSLSGWTSPGARLTVTVNQRSSGVGAEALRLDRRTITAPAARPAVIVQRGLLGIGGLTFAWYGSG